MAAIIGSEQAREDYRWIHGDQQLNARGELMAYLRYAAEEGDDERASLNMTTREYDHVGGYALSDRFVSWLEVQCAIVRLPPVHRQALALFMAPGAEPKAVARCLHCTEHQVFALVFEAIDALVAIVYD